MQELKSYLGKFEWSWIFSADFRFHGPVPTYNPYAVKYPVELTIFRLWKVIFRCYLWKIFGYIRKTNVFCISQWKSKNAKKGSCLGVTCSTYASHIEEPLVPQGPLCPKDQESSPFVYTYLQPLKRYSRKTSKKSIFFIVFLPDFGQIAQMFVQFWSNFWPFHLLNFFWKDS